MAVKGSKELQARLLAISKKFENDVKGEVGFALTEIELGAKRDAPGPGDLIDNDYGTPEKQSDIARGKNWTPINQAITKVMDSTGLKGSVVVDKSAGELAIYVEFGTGQSAASYLPTVPKEFQDIARRYYINGKGTIVNAPYLLPNYFRERTEFIKNLKTLVDNLKL